MRKMRILTMLLLVFVLVLAGCSKAKPVEEVEVQKATTFTSLMVDARKDEDVLTVQGHSTHTADLLVLEQYDGTEVFVVDYAGALSSAGAVTFADDVTFTLDAAQTVLIDADTTAHTATGLDVDVATITADVSAIDIAITQNTGATAAEDVFGVVLTMTADDADGDVFGIFITAAATTNAAAGSYEAGLVFECTENTSGACLDGIRVTATGHATAITDGIDVSHTGILNAVSIGSNLILGDNDDSFTVGATNNAFIFAVDGTNTATISGADAAGVADTIFTTAGAGAITLGGAAVTAITIDTDATGDAELVLPLLSVSAGEITANTITFAQISNSSAVDADTDFTLADGIELSLTPSHTDGTTEALLIDADQVDDGDGADNMWVFKIDATSESGDAGDTFYGIGVVWEEGTANTIMDAAIFIDNEETTTATMSDAIIVTSSGVNEGVTDGLDVSAANILYAVNIGANPIIGDPTNLDQLTLGVTNHHLILLGNEAAALTFMGQDDSGASDTVFDTGGAGTVTIGSGDVTNVSIDSDVGLTFTENGESINNLANATFDFTSNTDTTVILTASDTDGVVAMQVLPGGAAELLLGGAATTNVTINSDVGLTFAGQSESINNLVDFTFDFTANAGGTVILTASDDDAVAALTILPGGAEEMILGGASTTNVTIDSDAGLTFAENSESIINSANATFDFTSNTDTAVILTASDTDGIVALTIEPGGAADLTLGSATATGVDLVANGNMDITISAGLDFVISANQFEVQDGSDFAHSAATNEGVVWVCEEQIDHTDVEAAVTMCVIPANANIVDSTFTVEIVWTDTAATAIDCGISGGDTDAYVDALNVQNAIEVNRCGDAVDMPLLNIMGDVGGTAVTVVCQAAETNNDAAAGQAILRIYYTLD